MSPAGARRVEGVILATIVLFGLLSVVSFRALLPLAAVATVALIWLQWKERPFHALLRSPPLWGFAALIGVGALTLFVTVDDDLTEHKLLQLSAIFLVGLLMVGGFARGAAHVDPGRLKIACLLSFGLMVAGILITGFLADWLMAAGLPDRLFRGPDDVMARAAIFLSVWVFIGALVFERWRWPLIGAGFVVLLVAHIGADSPLASVLAFACGLAGAGLAFVFGRRAVVAIGVLAVGALFLMTPVFHLSGERILGAARAAEGDVQPDGMARAVFKQGNVGHRLEIWSSAAHRAVERPWLGWGLDASRRVPATRETYSGRVRTTIDLHPHNAFLQIPLEMGFLGVVAVTALIGALTRQGRRLAEDRAVAMALAGASAAALMVFSVSYGVFQSWWIAGLFLIAAFLALIAKVVGAKTASVQP